MRFVLLSLAFLSALSVFGRILFRRYSWSSTNSLRLEVFLYIFPVFLLCQLLLNLLDATLTLPLSILFLSFLFILAGGLAILEREFRAPAFAGLALFLSILFCGEILLSSLPADRLPQAVMNPPLLYSDRLDRAGKIYRTKGFRGRKPESESANGALRIFAMGGSSTWGVPLVNPREAYPAVLQTLVKERQPGGKIEVYNAGLAGMGVMQVLDSLSETILRFHPHIVTISLWYNDSSRQSIWYGVPGRSDRDVYLSERMLKWVSRLPLLNHFFHSRIYGSLRYLLLEGKGLFRGEPPAVATGRKEIAMNPRRMSPEEYRWALEEIAKLGERKKFLPVFVFEPLNRTSSMEESMKENEYYAAMTQVAEKYQIPLVDTLTPFHERMGDWLFYDLVHPNPSGHRLMAEILYDFLFSPEKIGPKGAEILRETGALKNPPQNTILRK